MLEERAVMCLGCGNEIPKATDKRNILTKQVDEIASLWRGFLRDFAEARHISLEDNGILSIEGGINVKDYGN